MAKILGKMHNPYVLGADTHSLTFITYKRQKDRGSLYNLYMSDLNTDDLDITV